MYVPLEIQYLFLLGSSDFESAKGKMDRNRADEE